MKAAVVSSFGTAPRYGEFSAPAAAGDDTVIDVIAAGLHPRVRSQADGSHYTRMVAVVTDRADRGKPLTWIEIGSVAGPTAPIPSAALRAVRLQIVGSGQGSVSSREILAELPALAREITNRTFDIDARPVPLFEVEQAWADAARTTQRIVLTPQP